MNPSDEQDDLWRLLGKAKTPAVSPYFSRNVLRDVRLARRDPAEAWGWLLRHWKATAVGACAVAVMGVFITQQMNVVVPDPLATIATELSESPDYLVITELDELLASEESSVWLDKPIY